MPRDTIIADAFRHLDGARRRASVAEVGGFRPPDTALASWFGGRFVGTADEAWPLGDGGPMLPVLQVRTDELPYVPEQLTGVALFNVFVGPRELPVDLPAPSGSGWEIRCYRNLAGLSPLSGEPKSHLKPFPVRWSLSESDAPGWDDAWGVFDLSAFNELPDAIDLFCDRYSNCSTTKVGGWPSYIQGAPDQSAGDFVFQIGSEAKAKWTWGDNGIGYFYSRGGEWMMRWDCY